MSMLSENTKRKHIRKRLKEALIQKNEKEAQELALELSRCGGGAAASILYEMQRYLDTRDENKKIRRIIARDLRRIGRIIK